ncbi:YfhO family protein [Lentilactobacillus parabuchneri]|uniref:Bacterial membrane protein YfhO n=6 Tax=Lentilactobacillus parabuchneri TaxID=152331 RepID=A0A1X1FBG3_9LACO|nr:YfhO family protein [Lentilactobacillus parabuchneri]ORN25447.1 Bacterial membrane protein YfhO [Lentilactobacillus parabuchneri]TLQ33248.1 YfhO family protein [Lentilactobacillus parabuchneri]
MKSKKITKVSILVLCFLVPVLISMSYFIFRHFAPFGNSSVMTVDLGQQYIDFFNNYHDTLLHSPSGFLFSFSKALGGDMLGTWAYYLMSPLNLIMLLFPLSKLPSVLGIITILKYGLAGLSFGYFLMKVTKHVGWSIVGFAASYSMMGWIVANQFNMLWTDVLFVLPMIFLGLSKILKNESSAIYIISLTAMLVINYYMSWMIAIFLTAFMLIYWAAKALPVKNQTQAKAVLKWLKASILSGILAAWLLVPTFFSLLGSKTQYSKGQYKIKFEYNPLDMIGKFFNGSVNFNELPAGTANIFVASVVIVLFVYYFFIPTIKRNVKFANLGLTVFMILSMCFQPLDLFWHGMQLPVWYTFRFSYLFSFWMIFTAFQAFLHILDEGINWKGYLVTAVVMVLGVLYVVWRGKHLEYMRHMDFVWGCIYLVVSLGLVIFIGLYRRNLVLGITLAILMSGEMALNMVTSLNHLDYLKATDYTAFERVIRKHVGAIQKKDRGFYRLGTTFSRTKNDAFTGNFNGGSIFSSTLESSTSQFFKNIGQPNGDSFVLYSNGTMFTDSLLNMKYYMSHQIPEANPNKKPKKQLLTTMTRKPDYNNYTLLDQDQLIGTYQNPYAVPIGFLSPESGMKQNEIAKSPITYQNEIAHRLDPKINNLFEPAKYTDIRYNNIQPISQLNNAVLKKKNLLEMSYIIFTVPIEKNTSYYMTLGTEINKGNISISVDGQAQTQFTPSEKTIIANIATGTTINTTANVQIFVNKNNALLQDVKLYKVHNSKIAQFSKDLNSHPYKVTKWNDHQLTGTVDVKSNNQSLTTTIPFEKGWHATVDGKSVKPKQWAKMFTYIPISKGHHKVVFTYWPQGLFAGIWITVFGFAFIGTEYFLKRRRNAKALTKQTPSDSK